MSRVEARQDWQRTKVLAAACCYCGWWVHDVAVMAWHGWLPRLAETLATSLVLGLGWIAVVVALGQSIWLTRSLFAIGMVLSVVPRLMVAVGWDLPVSTLAASAPKTLTALGLAVAFAVAVTRDSRSRVGRLCGVAVGAGCACAGGLYILRGGRLEIDGNEASVLALLTGGLLALAVLTLRRSITVLTVAAAVVAIGLVGSAAASRNTVLRSGPDRTKPVAQVGGVRPPNLVLIVLDTVSAKHLQTHGYERSTMPLLEQFAARHATTYLNARSASSWTLPSHGTLFTGLLPVEHGAIRRSDPLASEPLSLFKFIQPLRSEVVTLAEQLSSAGYQTGALVANASILHPSMGMDRGFHLFDRRAPELFTVPRGLLLHLSSHFAELGTKYYYGSRIISNRAVRWLDSRNSVPYFLFANFLDAHSPLIPTDAVRHAFDSAQPGDQVWPEQEHLELLYDRELLALDRGLFRLLSALEQREDFGNTVIVITSDHGESFGGHELWGHDRWLYEDLLLVPLVVKPVGQRALVSSEEPLRATKVHATMLAQLGLEPLNNGLALRSTVTEPPIAEVYWSAARAVQGEADERRAAWLSGSIKTIVDSSGRFEMYDLLQDPHELVNLATDEDRARSLSLATDWWSTRPWRSEEIPLDNRPDPEALKMLEALGYLGGN